MSRVARILTIFGVLIGLSAANAVLRAEPPESSRGPGATVPRDGVILLKNGQVLAGRITWSGDHYFVDRGGLQMGVRAAEVIATAADMDDAYRQQQAGLTKGDLDGHQLLAQWCLRHGLLGYAATELAECEAIHPGNPRTALLMRQLQSAMRVAGAASTSADERDPVQRDEVRTPATEQPRVGAATTNEHLSAQDARATPALSNQAMETFVTTIQPLLINQCAGGGCHGGATAAELKLQRFDPRRSPSRIYTERNLAAVLKFVDRGNPSASPLLTAPSQPHGSAKEAIFSGRTLVYQAELAAWVRSAVGGAERASRVESATAVDKNRGKSSAARARYEENVAVPRRAVNGDTGTPGEATDRASAANPHDPDVFNHRFFPDGRTPGGTDAANPGTTETAEPDAAASEDRPDHLVRGRRPMETKLVRPMPGRAIPERASSPSVPKRGSVGDDEIPPFESIEEG